VGEDVGLLSSRGLCEHTLRAGAGDNYADEMAPMRLT